MLGHLYRYCTLTLHSFFESKISLGGVFSRRIEQSKATWRWCQSWRDVQLAAGLCLKYLPIYNLQE